MLILKDLMLCIAQLEQDGLPSAKSSAFPLNIRPKGLRSPTAPATGGYFPCHYFDYIAGLGFGGYVYNTDESSLLIQSYQYPCDYVGTVEDDSGRVP